jgi:hypothetical protein
MENLEPNYDAVFDVYDTYIKGMNDEDVVKLETTTKKLCKINKRLRIVDNILEPLTIIAAFIFVLSGVFGYWLLFGILAVVCIGLVVLLKYVEDRIWVNDIIIVGINSDIHEYELTKLNRNRTCEFK